MKAYKFGADFLHPSSSAFVLATGQLRPSYQRPGVARSTRMTVANLNC